MVIAAVICHEFELSRMRHPLRVEGERGLFVEILQPVGAHSVGFARMVIAVDVAVLIDITL